MICDVIWQQDRGGSDDNCRMTDQNEWGRGLYSASRASPAVLKRDLHECELCEIRGATTQYVVVKE